MSTSQRSISSSSSRNAGRNIVVLLDGTGNEYGHKNSNLIKLMSVLKVDTESQLCYYSSGLGTLLPPGGSIGVVTAKLAQIADVATGRNFETFVCDAYKYLMDTYRENDKIYIFGFSRGAYTARALAGMLQRVGLLMPNNHNQIPLAYDIYKGPFQTKDENGKVITDGTTPIDPAVLFRRIFGRSRLVNVEFMGVWDTVSSLGGVSLPKLPFAAGPKSIRYFRQALALDEKRARFVPEYWRSDREQEELEEKIDKYKHELETKKRGSPAHMHLSAELIKAERELCAEYPQTDDSILKNKETWFMGAHSDVGGGVSNNDAASLSNIPFRWMLKEAVEVGLLLDPAGVSKQRALLENHSYGNRALASIDDTMERLRELSGVLDETATDGKLALLNWERLTDKSRQVSHQSLVELVKAMAAKDSESASPSSQDLIQGISYSLTWKWWFLEFCLLKSRHYTPHGAKEDCLRINFFRPRQVIPGQKIHASVRERMLYDQGPSPSAAIYKEPMARVSDDMLPWEELVISKSHGDIWDY